VYGIEGSGEIPCGPEPTLSEKERTELPEEFGRCVLYLEAEEGTAGAKGRWPSFEATAPSI
jgi:hypothetical protein